MHQYQPPDKGPYGSWLDVLVIIRVVFGLLFPMLGVLALALGLVVLTAVLFFAHSPLAIVPLAVIVLGLYWLSRRDRKVRAEQERRLLGH